MEYWSAFQLAQHGENPYDPALLFAVQHQAGLGWHLPTMMWNPPWLFLVMFPILRLDFLTALACWRVVTLLVGGASVFLVQAALNDPNDDSTQNYLVPLLALLTYYPLWHGIESGQIHALLLLAFSCMFYGLVRQKNWCVAVGILLCSVKPHIFYLPLLAIAQQDLRARNFWRTGTSASLIALAALISQVLWPHSISNWITALGMDPAGRYIPVQSWVVPTVVGFTRNLFSDSHGMMSVYPMILIPGVTGALVFCWLIRQPRLNWKVLLPPLMVLSYLTSPYGWVSDQLILLPAVLALLVQGSKKGGLALLLCAIAIFMQPITFALRLYWIHYEHQFFVFPAIILILCCVDIGSRRRNTPA